MGKDEELTSALPGLTVRAISAVAADEGTADCSLWCRCDDGSDYAVKDKSKHPALPHIEWFCTRLGERVGLASPPCAIVDIQGHEAFGSRWETGHEPDNWWIRAKNEEIRFSDLSASISRIFAFDLFIHNTDRHLKNYIVRRQRSGYSILSFDYSRAWLWNGFPPPALPLDPACNTIIGFRYLNQCFPDFLSSPDVDHVLKRLSDLTTQNIQAIISEHPKCWLTDEQSNTIVMWWSSDERLRRIASIKEGIGNGTHL